MFKQCTQCQKVYRRHSIQHPLMFTAWHSVSCSYFLLTARGGVKHMEPSFCMCGTHDETFQQCHMMYEPISLYTLLSYHPRLSSFCSCARLIRLAARDHRRHYMQSVLQSFNPFFLSQWSFLSYYQSCAMDLRLKAPWSKQMLARLVIKVFTLASS